MENKLKSSKAKNLYKKYQEMAFNTHVKKIYIEINSLCEDGHSPNYFIFENLVRHIKVKKSFMNNSESLQALFNTSIFSNLFLKFSYKISQNFKKTYREHLLQQTKEYFM